MMVLGNLRLDRINLDQETSSSLKLPSKLDTFFRDFRIMRQTALYSTYTYLTSDLNKERYRRLRAFLTRSKSEVSSGLTRYHNFAFWWKVEEGRYGSNFRRWWRWRKAKQEGVVGFYMGSALVVGGLTVLIGVWRGSRKRGKFSY